MLKLQFWSTTKEKLGEMEENNVVNNTKSLIHMLLYIPFIQRRHMLAKLA
jgi:hypothetical protein